MSGSWIQTYTGKRFFYDNFEQNVIDPLDIAHALSNICRFGGHCNTFYSVAQHSVLVSYACPNALAGLLHDSTEAYMIDVPSPLKYLLPDYKRMENELAAIIERRFGLEPGAFSTNALHYADKLLLSTERRDVLKNDHILWGAEIPPPAADKINPVSPFVARKLFMDRLFELKGITERWNEQDREEDAAAAKASAAALAA